MSEEIEIEPNTIYLKDYTAPDFWVKKVDMVFELDAKETRVTSTLQIQRNNDASKIESVQSPLVLDGQLLELISVSVNNKELTDSEYEVTEDKLTIPNVPENFEIVTVVKNFPEKNKALEGLYASSAMLCTQCEAEGFRRISYFPDRPDVMSEFTVTLIANKEKYPVLLSNGNKVDSGDSDNGKHWAKWHDPSLKPCYLFALVAGQLIYKQDSFTTQSGREVDLRIYVEEANSHKTDFALTCLKQSMLWDEQTYGREYDLDVFMIVAVDDFNMGAMENKGLNIFNSSCVLASSETATDANFYNIQSIIGHEYFHNWSGNRVTCRDWFQLSLKEGFTVFRDQEFSSDLNSRAVKRIDDVNVLRNHQFAQDAGPLAHPIRPDKYIEISNFYTVTVYNKGAEIVRMLHNLVGGEGFRKGTDCYFSRHDGQAVTTEDFVKAIEDTNNRDFSQFQNWYNQSGTPVLTFKDEYNAQLQTYTLTSIQSFGELETQKNNKPFHVPVEIGLLGSAGNEMQLDIADSHVSNVTSTVLEITELEQSFIFNNIKEKPLPSLLRGFSAPVKIHYEYTREDLAFLMAHDSDEFNRWDASQQLGIKLVLSLMDAHKENKKLIVDDFILNAYKSVLENKELDMALAAQLLTLPSESYIADQCAIVDVDAIHTVRKFVRRQLAEQLETEFESCYHRNVTHEDYVFNSEAMAQRSLKNLCLAYLAELETEKHLQQCYQQFQTANNMTDQLSAVNILANHECEYRQPTLDGFYEQWKSDNQVVEKWLAIQSGADLPASLLKVKKLMQHPAFSMSNPNKIRAVIGSFCGINAVSFHAENGEGYEFLTDQVLVLDQSNPQIAARLLQIMIRWQRYDQSRQALMKKQFERILETKPLSKDVFEIASRAIG